MLLNISCHHPAHGLILGANFSPILQKNINKLYTFIQLTLEKFLLYPEGYHYPNEHRSDKHTDYRNFGGGKLDANPQ